MSEMNVSDRKGVTLKMCGESWEWGVSLLLLPNETISVVDSEENLSSFVREFGRVCKRRKLKNNVGKIKVLRLTLREEEEKG